MADLDIILILMAVLAGLYSIADKIGISYPILLVLAGLGIGLIPGLPVVQLSPDVVFLLFLPPLLFDAARHMSWHDFRENRAAIGRLAIGLVLFTTIGVAVCAHYMIPGFTWPLAFALGAIVSPPDAVAATSAIKGLHLPKRLVAVLEGESLVNDATALIVYRYAVLAIVSGTFVLWQAALQFVFVAVGGIIIGLAVGFAFIWVQKKILYNPTVETVITILVPFVSYLLAEHTSVSGVLSVVTTGLMISWRAHEIFSFRTRMQMNSFWETIIFLLNGFVFVLIGLQLPAIVNDIGDHTLGEMIGYGLLISAVVVMVRLVWIFPTVYLANWWERKRGKAETGTKSNAHLMILGWSGMRGVISLATALALPLMMENGQEFPQRNVILFITFVVILVTLVFQGLTLPHLIRWLNAAESPERAMAEERRLRLVLANSALNFVNETLAPKMPSQAIGGVKERLERQVNYLKGILHTGQNDTAGMNVMAQDELFHNYLQSEKAVIDHQRELMIQMHKKGAFDEEVLRRIEQDLDSRSLTLAGRSRAFQ